MNLLIMAKLPDVPLTRPGRKSNQDKPEWTYAFVALRIEARYMSANALAKATSISHGKFSRMEAGYETPREIFNYEERVRLLRVLKITHEEWLRRVGQPLFDDDVPPPPDLMEAVRAAAHLEVDETMAPFPILASVSAGGGKGTVLEGETIGIPRSKLKAMGVREENVRVYLVNGDCMVSQSVLIMEKSIAPGDVIAVDAGRRPRHGEVAVAWWPDEEQLIVKRVGYDQAGTLLIPTKPNFPTRVLPDDSEHMIIGPMFYRAG